MAQNHIFCSGRFDHLGRDFTGISSGSVIGTILSGQTQFFIVYSFTDSGQMNKGSAYNYPARIIFFG